MDVLAHDMDVQALSSAVSKWGNPCLFQNQEIRFSASFLLYLLCYIIALLLFSSTIRNKMPSFIVCDNYNQRYIHSLQVSPKSISIRMWSKALEFGLQGYGFEFRLIHEFL